MRDQNEIAHWLTLLLGLNWQWVKLCDPEWQPHWTAEERMPFFNCQYSVWSHVVYDLCFKAGVLTVAGPPLWPWPGDKCCFLTLNRTCGELSHFKAWFILVWMPSYDVMPSYDEANIKHYLASSCSSKGFTSLSGVLTLSVLTIHVGRCRLSRTISCCRSCFNSSIWAFRSEFIISSRSDS